MNARLIAAALALAWSGVVLAGCTERPTEPLLTRKPVADVGPLVVFDPVAMAGPDVSAFIGESVTLQGSAKDPYDREIVEWQWQVLWGPDGATLSNPSSDYTDFTGDMAGDYIVTLTACVDDVDLGLLCSKPDSVTVSVVNREPMAWITAKPTTVTVGETVVFDGSGSYDPDQQQLTYSWNFQDGWISNNVSPSHAFAAAGEYWVTLEVSDGWLTDAEEILITVEEEPGPQAGIQALISGIQSLVSGGQLSADRGDGLLSKLNAALTSLNNGLTTDACKQLSAFAKQVTASIKAKKLDSGVGQSLIQSAEAIRTQIGCA